MFRSNLEQVKEKIRRSAIKIGTDPDKITLVCVTKGIDIDRIKEAVSLGITDIGENRVQEAKVKFSLLTHNSVPNEAIQKEFTSGSRSAKEEVITFGKLVTHNKLNWHLIGHLQKNKARDAVKIFDLIHSVDSLSLAEEINKEAEKINKIQEVLIQVNTSNEATKFGINSEGALSLVKEILKLPNLKLKGLMTIAPLVDNPENVRPYFKALRELRDKIYDLRITDYELPNLSMGMSQDYQIAIEEGATMVRIGTAIFKDENDH